MPNVFLYETTQFFDNSGNPLVGGQIFTYFPGSTTPLPVYTDSTGTALASNPVICDSAGQAQLWLTANSYKIVIATRGGVHLATLDGLNVIPPSGDLDHLNCTGDVTIEQIVSATAGANQSSKSIFLQGTFWDGFQSRIDQWAISNTLGSGVNPSSTLHITGSGSTGTRTIDLLGFTVSGNPLTGFIVSVSKLTATSELDVGNSKVTSSATVARAVTLPDADSVTVQPSTAAAHQFATAVSAAGVLTYTQPAFTDLSGSASAGQLPALTTLSNQGTTHQVLHGNAAGNLAFSAVDVASADVTGILPTANGGTGQNSTATFPTSGVVVTEAATETLTAKRITKRAVTVADATSITPNADTSDIVIQANTQAGGTLTINAPTGTPTDGQPLLIRIKSTNAQTYSFNAAFRFSSTTTAPTGITAGKTDLLAFVWNATDSKWDVAGVNQGH